MKRQVIFIILLNLYVVIPAQAMLQAAQSGNSARVQQLIDACADVNQTNNVGETALYWAVLNGHTQIISQLIKAGADVNKANRDGYTPLYWAVHGGYTQIVNQLVGAGVDVNKATSGGGTPLHLAAGGGHLTAVRILLAAGASDKVRDYGSSEFPNGKTPKEGAQKVLKHRRLTGQGDGSFQAIIDLLH